MTERAGPVRIAIGPDQGVFPVDDLVPDGIAVRTDVGDAEVLVWNQFARPDELTRLLTAGPGIRWVHLVFSGTELVREAIVPGVVWTSGKEALALPVAEHALALLLAVDRQVGYHVRHGADAEPRGMMTSGRSIGVLGGGHIAEQFLRLAAPFGGERIVVRRDASAPVPGADRVVGVDDLDAALSTVDTLVVALALTPETVGIVDRRRLSAMRPGSSLVNVARGRHVVTDDLVDALRGGHLGGAGLDVTDPEPLPADHPLRRMDNVVITPHVAGTRTAGRSLTRRWLAENVARFAAGDPLTSVVDVGLRY